MAIKSKDLIKVNVSHLKDLETAFIERTKKSLEIPVPLKFFVPLAAKVLGRNFNKSEKDPTKLAASKIKIKDFSNIINSHATKYIATNSFGETAYAFFNVLTDYVSNNPELPAGSINGLQTKCGIWINQIGELVLKPGFDWDEEIKDFTYLLN